MNNVSLNVSDEELRILRKIFENEPNFDPKTIEDRVIVGILKSILDQASNNEGNS
jgi:hypothetical protein